ncbi:5-deoxy-glucuronate isomerase [Tuberibacillus sp. Marseille-P3662]|uniref:5-deoxy-glucuronate isomerase n=1 Tax=Tuberibacillus sp. Marseille-P3662 TaxID=1965358 RepID=UPI000A1CA56C|nr:5-deoxy-glucuronate isomerase [Tuberibacillus sp. Marseille-P3662]
MANLIVPSGNPDENGQVLRVTPESANWKYVGFEVYSLEKGKTIQDETENNEACIVILSGKANIATQNEQWNNLGHRMNVFEKTPPYSVYVPSSDSFSVEALTDLEIAVCLAPGQGTYEARLIAPDDVGVEHRGAGHMQRQVHNILPEQNPADSLLVVEVFTPDGNYSSYPPHKHDEDRLPEESYLEETYYHKINPESGFLFHRVYTDDRSLDEAMAVHHNETVLVPKGYHPVSAPPGYDVYYLNVMAGPVRTWQFTNDPDHEWLFEKMNK